VPGSLSHLTRRFFEVLTAQPLTVAESDWVEERLRPDEAACFFSQPRPDQRHGRSAALVVTEAGVTDPVMIRAALLHDIGKRHSGLGVIGRSLASIAIRLHLPLIRRFRLYRDHGELGAAELTRAGCEPLIVDFARHHHASRPGSIAQDAWDLLLKADQPAKTRSTRRARISS
jgi:putative nucleotidyltransferase with HDIG domain